MSKPADRHGKTDGLTVPSVAEIETFYSKYDITVREAAIQAEIGSWTTMLTHRVKERDELRKLVGNGFSTPYVSAAMIRSFLPYAERRVENAKMIIQNLQTVKQRVSMKRHQTTQQK